MSTMPSQLNAAPVSWKQEVNRRLAAHKSRRGSAKILSDQLITAPRPANSRAADAMARVAARYAHAPSYSEVLADGARAAVRAAEAATRAAVEAHAAARDVLAGLEAASDAAQAAENSRASFFEAAEVCQAQPEPEEFLPAPVSRQDYAVRWDDALPERSPEPAFVASRNTAAYEIVPEGWQQAVRASRDQESEPVELVEPARPIPGNLIEFPRELVAARKVRPRLAEGPLVEPEAQLSIFEVDPATVSTVVEEPAPETAANEAVFDWREPEWRDMTLPEEPEELEALRAPMQAQAPEIEAAPVGMRLMAAAVNASLVTGAFLAVAMLVMTHANTLPGLRAMEIGAGVGLALTAALYALLFYALGDGTPGMRYAHLRLATFDGRRTVRNERIFRLGGMLLSALPMGLGFAWTIFDEDRLCWHDRLSRTYVRRF